MNRKWGSKTQSGIWLMLVGGMLCAFALGAAVANRSNEAHAALAIGLPQTENPKPEFDVVTRGNAIRLTVGTSTCAIQKVTIDGTDYFVTTTNCTLTYKGWR